MIGRVYLERGRPVRVLARWNGAGPRNVLVTRMCRDCDGHGPPGCTCGGTGDGELVVRPFRGLRRDRDRRVHCPLCGRCVVTTEAPCECGFRFPRGYEPGRKP